MRGARGIKRAVLLLIGAAFLLYGPSLATAQRVEPAPKQLAGVGVEEHLEAQLPLDAPFRRDDGQQIKLGDVFTGERPVILSLNYSNCPMLCNLQLNGLVDGLQDWSWSVGQEFEIVSVSIDPLETPQRARETKQRYLRSYGRSGAGKGWHFLTGDEVSIKRLAETVGFQYRYLPERNEYVHAAVLMICTPDGRISRYLYGVEYPRQTLRLSLVEAGEGKIGTAMDQILLFCFHYDAEEGRYGPTARSLMKLGGGVTLLVVLVAIVPYWFRRKSSVETQ